MVSATAFRALTIAQAGVQEAASLNQTDEKLITSLEDLVQNAPVPLTPEDIREIRRRVARSTREFERVFRIPARTMEAYEQGRRKPDTATQALLTIIEREPEAAKRALSGLPPWSDDF